MIKLTLQEGKRRVIKDVVFEDGVAMLPDEMAPKARYIKRYYNVDVEMVTEDEESEDLESLLGVEDEVEDEDEDEE